MTHDPLCPQAYPYGRDDDLDSFFGKKDWDCRCELIAKVRADERNGCIKELENYYCPDEDTDYWTGFEDGIRKSIDLLDMGRTYD